MNDDQCKLQVLDEPSAMQIAQLFRVFSDSSRIRTVSLLMRDEMNVGDLANVVGVSHSSISHHLRCLRRMRLVNSRKSGKEVYYRVNDIHMIGLLRKFLGQLLGRQREDIVSFPEASAWVRNQDALVMYE